MGAFLSCHCLGDSIFGMDVDDVFAYQTPKIVRIKDRSLGLIRIALTSLIFSYIVFYQIFYKGEHFKSEGVEGVARLQWQQPTMNWCNPMHVDCKSNFTHAKHLPYCAQYTGPKQFAGVGKRRCSYKDAWDLPIQLPSGVLIPTYEEVYRQKRTCEPGEDECVGQYQFQEGAVAGAPLQTGRGDAEPNKEFFVADVDDFSVLIDHAFSTASGAYAQDDFGMQGYWLDCSGVVDGCVRRPIKCAHSQCDALGHALLQESAHAEGCTDHECGGQPSTSVQRGLRRGRGERGAIGLAQQSEDVAGGDRHEAVSTMNVIALKDGDVMSIKTMLAMAKSSAQARAPPPGGYSLDDVVNSAGETRRLRGAVLEVKIDYDNAGSWRIFTPKDPPSYTISVSMQQASEFKHLSTTQLDDDRRQVAKAYGILIIVQQVGRLVSFDALHAMIVLTAAVGLLAVANLMTDMLAIYLMPRAEIYSELKYQESADLVTVNPDKDS